MKQNYIFILVVSMIAFCSFTSLGFEIQHKVTFRQSKIKTEDINVMGKTFTSIDYDGLLKTGQTGEASLPYEILEFEVPSDVYSFTISTKTGRTQLIPLTYGMEISQEPIMSGQVSTESKLIDSYNSTVFPDAVATIVQDGYRNGDIHMLQVAVYPFRYDADSGRLFFAESIELTIKDASGIQPASGLTHTFTSPLRPLRKLKSSVTDKNNSAIGNYRSTPTVGNGLPAYEYAVITSRKLARAFEKIIGLKKQKGLDAGVVCIEDILSDTAFAMGDTISHINDDAGKLRAYLMACRQSRDGDMFVLLGGNQNIIPVRNAYESNHYHNVEIIGGKEYRFPHPLGYYVPTDWYYIDINGNWDFNQNGNYAESGESSKMDFNPDIYVGRICCQNEQEVYNYEYKLLKYEMNPGNGDFSYLRRELNTQSDQMQRDNQAIKSSSITKKIFEEVKIYEEKPSYNSPSPYEPYASDIIDDINSIGYGFINHHAHGGTLSTNVRAASLNDSIRYGLVSLQKIPKKYSYARYEDRHGLDMMNNYNRPAIFYSLSCDLMPYDNMLMYVKKENGNVGEFELTIPADYYNFGDSFTIGGLYGGAAFIGNTRYGWIDESFEQEKVFLSLLLNDGCLGRSRAKTQTLFTTDHHCRLTNNLLGCPEFKMWIKTPRNINITYAQMTTSDNQKLICESDVIAVGVDLSNGAVSRYDDMITKDGSKTISIPVKNSVVALTGDYRIPKRMTLQLDNLTVNANGYYFVDDITSVWNNPSSSIKFDGARVTFDAIGSVNLTQPLVIDNGSDVTFIATGPASFSQIEIKNGSRLTIDSNGYTLEGESLCELGSELIIK